MFLNTQKYYARRVPEYMSHEMTIFPSVSIYSCAYYKKNK